MKRSDLKALLAQIHPAQPLGEFHWLQITNIMRTILEGYDVRRDFGIKPKRGTRPTTQARQKLIVRHFLYLCARDRKTSEKAHRLTVASEWGKPENEIAKLVRKWRKTLHFNATDAEFMEKNLPGILGIMGRR